jgi:TRAP-type C4-dicarboxylate transport system substrate-binding protein
MKAIKLLKVGCVILIATILTISGCSKEESPTSTEEPVKAIELTLANQHPSEAPMNKVVNDAWARWIEKETGGRVKVTVLPAETVAKSADIYDAARTGIVDIGCQFLIMTPGRFPLNEVTELPLIFPCSRSAALTHMALYEKYPELQNEFKGVKVLGFHANGPAQVHTLKKPIRTLEDWKGQVMVGWGPYAADIITALGGTPEMIGPAELYDALAKGVVDGNLIEWEGEHIWHYNDVAKYSTEANFYISPFVHVMNLDRYNSLPPDIQELFTGEKARLYFEVHGYNFDKDDASYKGQLDEQYSKAGLPGIYTLPQEEQERWLNAIMPVRESWIEKAESLGAPGRAILEDAIRLAKEFDESPSDHCEETLRQWEAQGH